MRPGVGIGRLGVIVGIAMASAGTWPPVSDHIFRRCSRGVVVSPPDDHFAAGPDCRVKVSRSGRIGGAGGRPTVCAGLYLPPVFKTGAADSRPPQTIISLPVHTAV